MKATVAECREVREGLNDILVRRAAEQAEAQELAAWAEMVGIATRLEMAAVEEAAADA